MDSYIEGLSPSQPNDSTELDYNGGTNVTYVGTANPGTPLSFPGWTIKYLTYDINNNILTVTYANKGSSFNIWNNRTSYTYS